MLYGTSVTVWSVQLKSGCVDMVYTTVKLKSDVMGTFLANFCCRGSILMALKQYFALNHPIAFKQSYYNGDKIIKSINDANIQYKKCRATNKYACLNSYNEQRIKMFWSSVSLVIDYRNMSSTRWSRSSSRSNWQWNFQSSFTTSLLMILANTFWRRPCSVNSSPMSMSLSISSDHLMIWLWLHKYLLLFKKSSMIAMAQ